MKHKIILNEKEYDVINGECVLSSGDLTFNIAINGDGTASMEVETYNPCSCDSSFSKYTLYEGEENRIFHYFKGDFRTYNVKFLTLDE